MKPNSLIKLILGVYTFSLLIDQCMLSPMRRAAIDHSSSSRKPPKSQSTGHHHHRIKCGLSDQVTPVGISHKKVPITNLLNAVVSPTRKAKQHAERVKLQFLNQMGEDFFESGLEHQRQDWLPHIPSATLEEFEEYSNLDEAFKKAFLLMQYFAVGMQQILLDITLYEGRLLTEFRHLEECLYQILCEVQLGMRVRGVVPDKHVLHEVMSHEYRDLRDGTQRNLRDFLILRDYIKALDFIQQLFTYLKIREQESRESK